MAAIARRAGSQRVLDRRAGPESGSGPVANHGEDARADELQRLRMALVVFAVQLDTFEMRARSALLGIGKSHQSAPLPDPGSGSLGKWALKG